MSRTLLVSLLLAALQTVICDDVTVKTKKGPIKGINVPANTGTTNVAYDAFLGIPYGNKPDRFQLATARTAWTDTLTTQSDGSVCPQLNSAYNEDCLNLNVFTPEGASKEGSTTTYPVMAFVPGEGFVYSSASSKVYGPDFLVNSKVIVVTINYRVGATGFLSLGSKTAPGNLGLHDVLLALQWIQDEIAAFGGDPTKVTLFGAGSGSVITQFHYLSPLSTGLFKNAIAHSGSALASWNLVTSTEARRRAVQLAKNLKCDTSKDDSTILACLQKADMKYILSNQSLAISDADMITGRDVPFVPVLDTTTTADKPFFSDSLDNLMKAAVTRAKPLISGFTADDGVVMFSKNSYLKAENNLAAFTRDGSGDKVNRMKKQYFDYSSPTLNKVQSLVSLYTDYLFANPSIKVTRAFASFTYGYVFSFSGPWKSVDTSNKFSQFKMKSAGHGDELRYLFYSSQYGDQTLDTCVANAATINMKNNMVKWWTTFAKTGVPDDSWPKVSKNGYFVIDSQTSITKEDDFEKQYYAFWEDMSKSGSSANSATAILLTLFLSLSTAVKSLYL